MRSTKLIQVSRYSVRNAWSCPATIASRYLVEALRSVTFNYMVDIWQQHVFFAFASFTTWITREPCIFNLNCTPLQLVKTESQCPSYEGSAMPSATLVAFVAMKSFSRGTWLSWIARPHSAIPRPSEINEREDVHCDARQHGCLKLIFSSIFNIYSKFKHKDPPGLSQLRSGMLQRCQCGGAPTLDMFQDGQFLSLHFTKIWLHTFFHCFSMDMMRDLIMCADLLQAKCQQTQRSKRSIKWTIPTLCRLAVTGQITMKLLGDCNAASTVW